MWLWGDPVLLAVPLCMRMARAACVLLPASADGAAEALLVALREHPKGEHASETALSFLIAELGQL